MAGSEMPLDAPNRLDEFVRLYTRHERRVYSYLVSLVHSVADAEELLQETAFVLWKKFDEFGPGTNFGAWACRVAYFEAAKFRRRRKGELPLNPQFFERIAQGSAEVSDLLELRADAFNDCVDRLSESDRQLLMRRYAPDGRVQAIAAELNRPPHSVSKSLARIRRTLLECIDRHLRQQERR
jgi:RNA polymerase sigma-70 factor (ECF subfamily)